MKKKTGAKKKAGLKKTKVRVVVETSEKGLAKQVAKAISAAAKRRRRGAKGPYAGWQQDKGPKPWGQKFTWAQEVKPPWDQSSARKRPSRKGQRVNPTRIRKRKKTKNVRRALAKAGGRQ